MKIPEKYVALSGNKFLFLQIRFISAYIASREDIMGNGNEMLNYPRHMRISELSAYTKTPLTTIKYYLREGLLPAPTRTDRNMWPYYTEEHLQKLLSIQQLKKEGLPLSTIRDVLQDNAVNSAPQAKSDAIFTSTREGIVQAAIGLFREKGYDTMKISDIAGRAGIGKGTFYQYFRNKEVLFFECTDSIFHDIGIDVEEIRHEKDPIEKLKLRAQHAIRSNRHMIDMLNLIRGASITKNPQFTVSLDRALESLIVPIRNDLEMAREQNRILPFDSTLGAHLLMGAAEYLLYYQKDFMVDTAVLLTKSLAIFFNDTVPEKVEDAEIMINKKLGKQGLTISELSRASDVSVSTILYYIREEILPPPLKTGKTSAYYSQIHLEGLLLIRKMQIEGKKSLPEIRDTLRRDLVSWSTNCEKAVLPSSRRKEILTAAIDLFSQKGYAETSIADIVNRAKMSKETFYLHFLNKEELFMDCADRIFYDMYNHVWQEIREEKDMQERIRKRARAFFASYPQWITMMNLVRGLSVGDNPAFQEKFRQLLWQITGPISREIRQLQIEGYYRKEIDSTIAGYVLMGMAEYGASLVHRGTHSSHEVLDCIFRLIQQGLVR
jgi:AcrR family transcriptional regulator